jgi:hypothetical protein
MNATTDLDRLLTAADPLDGADADLPPLTAEIDSARAAGEATVGREPSLVPWRRHPVLVASAAVGLAAAVTAAALIVPSGTPGAPDRAAAQALTQLVTNVRRAAPIAYSTTVYRVHEIDQVSTATGYATYRQTTIRTETVTADGTTNRYVFGPPRWLTPADARRAEHVTDPALPQRGIGHLHQPPCPTGAGHYCLTSAYLASLPTTSAGLAARLRADVDTRGGCASGPGCQADNLIPILFAAGASGPLRASALALLAQSPGISILGNRTIDGHRGFAFRNEHGEDGGPDVLVVDQRDGTELAEYNYSTASSWQSPNPPVPVGTRIGSEVRVR